MHGNPLVTRVPGTARLQTHAAPRLTAPSVIPNQEPSEGADQRAEGRRGLGKWRARRVRPKPRSPSARRFAASEVLWLEGRAARRENRKSRMSDISGRKRGDCVISVDSVESCGVNKNIVKRLTNVAEYGIIPSAAQDARRGIPSTPSHAGLHGSPRRAGRQISSQERVAFRPGWPQVEDATWNMRKAVVL